MAFDFKDVVINASKPITAMRLLRRLYRLAWLSLLGAAHAAFLKRNTAADVTVVVAEEELHAYSVFYPFSEVMRFLQSQKADLMNR